MNCIGTYPKEAWKKVANILQKKKIKSILTKKTVYVKNNFFSVFLGGQDAPNRPPAITWNIANTVRESKTMLLGLHELMWFAVGLQW